MNIYDHIGKPSKKYYREICRLTEPLKLFLGVDRFWRNSHGIDGSYSVLGNCPPVAESFFGQKLYIGHPYFRNPRYFQSGYTLPELLNSQEYEETQGRLRKEGDCHHVLIYIQKHEHGFVEYGFAASRLHKGFEMIYLNHLQMISKFITSFEANANKLIRDAEQFAITMPALIGAKYLEKPVLNGTILVPDKELQFLASLEKTPERVQGLKALTKCERLVLREYLSGCSTKVIAQKLFRSPRTIESHLEHIKSKIGVNSRSMLFEILLPFREVL